MKNKIQFDMETAIQTQREGKAKTSTANEVPTPRIKQLSEAAGDQGEARTPVWHFG